MSADAAAPMPHRGLIWLCSIAAGITVANLYYAQPLAHVIAADLKASEAAVGSALVGMQLGYAVGMLTLATLGDILERRATIVATSLGCAAMLLAFSASTSTWMLAATAALVGLGASVTQMILPYAVGLVPPAQRGAVVGHVMGGVLAGILISRVASGALADVLGWRGVFVAASGLMVVLAGVLRVWLAPSRPEAPIRYRTLMASLWGILRRERVLRRRCLVGAFGFASFSVFWSTIAFQVASPAIGRGSREAGLLGIVGLTGVIVAPIAGRLAMGGAPSRVNVGALVITAASFAIFGVWASSLLVIGAGIVLLDAGVQANHLTNQTVIFGLSPAERSRINAIYMVAYFLGGALGTFAGAQAWAHAGWPGVCVAGAAFALAALPPLRGAST